MNDNCQNRQKCQNPKGWDKPWPFADEVQLYRIPEGEALTAFEWEIERQRRIVDGRMEELEGTGNAMPWLFLPEDFKLHLLDKYANKQTEYTPAARLATEKETLKAFKEFKPEEANLRGISLPFADQKQPAAPLPLYDEFYNENTFVLCLRVRPEHGREAIRKALGEMLDSMEEIPKRSGSGKQSDALNNLKKLAHLRAKDEQASGNYMRYFRGTPYEMDQRDADKKVSAFRQKYVTPWTV